MTVLLPAAMFQPAASVETFQLLVSSAADRSAPVALDGTTQAGSIYVFTTPTTGVAKVRFYLDDPGMTATPRQVEKGVPHDFAGTAKDGSALPFKTWTVPTGTHTITAAIDLATGGTTVVSATFSVDDQQAPSPYQLMTSSLPDRAAAVPLAGATVEGSVYVFTAPEAGISRVRFFIDDPQMTGTPSKVEGGAPYDLAGTATNGTALPYDTSVLPAGQHVISASIEQTDGSVTTTSAAFTVEQSVALPDLTLDRTSVTMSGPVGGDAERAAVSLGTSNGTTANYTVTTSAPWLSVQPGSTTAPTTVDIVATPGSFAVGTYSGTVTFSATGYDPVTLAVSFWVRQTTGAAYDVVMSSSKSRTSPKLLDGKTVTGKIYPFLDPATDVTTTSWWLDDPTMSGTPWRTDGSAPFDFMPGSTASAAKPFDTATVPDGTHTITVSVQGPGSDPEVVSVSFVTDNSTNSLTWSPGARTIDVDPANPTPVTFESTLTADNAGTVATLSGGEPFVTHDVGSSATTPATVTTTVDPSELSPGAYRFTVTAEAPGTFTATLPITVNVGDSMGCAPIACDHIKVDHPYVLPFDGPQGGIIDRHGTGTGFTTLLDGDASHYVRNALELDGPSSTMKITPGAGNFKGADNGQDNALGVGFNGGVLNVVTTTLTHIPATQGKYEQAGLWFGYDQDHVYKLDLVSTPNGPRVEQTLEVDGAKVASKQGAILSLNPEDDVQLSVQADPVTRKLTGSYRINGGAALALTALSTPGEFFSADAAGIDPRIGTRTFAGIYASKRTSTATPVYEFGDFSVTGEPVSAATDLEFTKKSHDVDFPTSMAFGPDGRLYVLTLMGDLHVLTFDDQHNVVDDQLVTTLGTRLALGIEIDPASTPTDVVVWVAHSSPSLNNGAADSGMITKLSGTSLQNRTDVITGLPRAIANHGSNSLHFGPDGRLYHAIGGNTGAGAANTASTEFGDRAEQPLSAAIVVADVNAPGFDGTCADPVDMYSSDDCDVAVYASGLRNTYDFVFHSNGNMYGPDNGLGVVGSYPPSPTPPCRGFGSTVSYKNGGNNPGEQPDELNKIVEGGYYGHPNPTRNECVFGDGSFQDVSPLPNYRPAMHDLGRSRSANGIIEYTEDGFCGALRSQLLVTNYSVGDDIVLLQLAQDGNSVVRSTSLVAGLSDPLPLVQAPDGSLVVGEFGGGTVTTLTPVDTGCWSEAAPLPVALLDAGGTAIGDDIYVVGGKTPAGPQSTVHKYDVSASTWTTASPLPGPAVENPATVAVGGKLYAFGGSTTPFAGAVGRSAVYDPGTNTWTTLPDMPTPRGGASAQHVNGKIYVLGGMTADGASSAVVEVFDIASRTWSTGPTMSTARDNPGAGVVDGTIYVFGGRTRLADGSTVNGALSSVEAWSHGAGSWTPRAPMPSGRRTMSSAVVGGKILLIGGEGASDGSAFDANERYDPGTDTWQRLWPIPTPRHGAAAAVVDGLVHVLGGGPTGGGAWTDKHEVLRPPA